MAWLYVLLAALLETAWAVGLKLSHGLTRPLPTAVSLVAYGLCFVCIAPAVKVLPASTAYTAWIGAGAVCVALVGIFWLDEAATPLRVISLLLVIAGIFGLGLSEGR